MALRLQWQLLITVLFMQCSPCLLRSITYWCISFQCKQLWKWMDLNKIITIRIDTQKLSRRIQMKNPLNLGNIIPIFTGHADDGSRMLQICVRFFPVREVEESWFHLGQRRNQIRTSISAVRQHIHSTFHAVFSVQCKNNFLNSFQILIHVSWLGMSWINMIEFLFLCISVFLIPILKFILLQLY